MYKIIIVGIKLYIVLFTFFLYIYIDTAHSSYFSSRDSV